MSDRERANAYLDDAELSISIWLPHTKNPPTSTAQKIAHAKRLSNAASELNSALEAMPTDVADFLNVIWLRFCYGNDYFKRHSEACEHDKKNQMNRIFYAFASALSTEPRPPYVTETDKLPPDFHKKLPGVQDFLRALRFAATEMAAMETGAKQWQNVELERELALFLALSYRKHFGKPPSSANGSSFRKFAAELSRLLGYRLGANTVAYACDAVKIHQENEPIS
jgi:hypothetical protein